MEMLREKINSKEEDFANLWYRIEEKDYMLNEEN